MQKKIVILVIFSLAIISNTFARAEQQIVSEIRKSIDRMDDNLQSSFAKAGLEMTVWNFYRARVALSPNQYEMTNDFKQGFKQSYFVFKNRLWAGDFEGLKSKIGESYLKEMEKLYNQNRTKYLGFIKSLAETPYFPPHYSSDLITESQTYFSLLLFDVQEREWAKAKKFTYIFPFCD